MRLLHEDVTGKILKSFFKVYDDLGFGFLEAVYRRALQLDLVALGLDVRAEVPISVRYRGTVVGHYRADLVVAGKVIVELKSLNDIGVAERKQLLNYLRGTGMSVGLLLNFGPKARFARMVNSTRHPSLLPDNFEGGIESLTEMADLPTSFHTSAVVRQPQRSSAPPAFARPLPQADDPAEIPPPLSDEEINAILADISALCEEPFEYPPPIEELY